MIDPTAKRIPSPIYKLLVYLNDHDDKKLESKNLQFLLKNIKTHFKKLIYSIALIRKTQADPDLMKRYDQTRALSAQQVEYCFYKISTIWDISYQIADDLIFPKNKPVKDKYEYLERQFDEYIGELPNLKTAWYREINKIRNRITHGGITINPFYIESEQVGRRICFQAYDLDLNDIIQTNHHYTNTQNNNINFADNFFTYFTHFLYTYLMDFFNFTLMELTKDKKIEIDGLEISNDFFGYFKQEHKTWLLSDIDHLEEITNDMILLNHVEGKKFMLQNIPPHFQEVIIKQAHTKPPFIMMGNISDGDWKIIDTTDE